MHKQIGGILMILTLLFSCKTGINPILENNENIFREEFLDHSLLIRGDLIEMQIYKGNLMNNYFFEKDKQQFDLKRDSLQFNLNEIIKYSEIDTAKNDRYKKQLEKVVGDLYAKMEKANVASFTSEFHKFGIDLMINIKDKKLLYVSDFDKITNAEWIKFVEQSEKQLQHWYVYQMPK